MLRGFRIHPTGSERFFGDSLSVQSPTTRRHYNGVLRRFQARWPDLRTNEVTLDHVRTFLAEGRESGWASATTYNHRTALASYFDWAYPESCPEPLGLLMRDRNKGIRVPKVQTKAGIWLCESEVEAILASCNMSVERGLRDRVLLGAGLLIGLRVHEILGTRWCDVSLDRGEILVLGKGNKEEIVPIPAGFREVLFSWRSVYAKALGCPVSTEPVVASSRVTGGINGSTKRYVVRYGRSLSASGAWNVCKLRGQAIGRDRLAPHDLRRSFAGILEARDVPLQRISEALRHDSVATTQIYLAKNPVRRREIAAVLDDLG